MLSICQLVCIYLLDPKWILIRLFITEDILLVNPTPNLDTVMMLFQKNICYVLKVGAEMVRFMNRCRIWIH